MGSLRREHALAGITVAVFLASQKCVICFEELFRGTIDSASVYPREVVKQALPNNAAAVILVHTPPRAIPNPAMPTGASPSACLKEALGLVEVRVIDHIVVGRE